MSWENYFRPPVVDAILSGLYTSHLVNARNFDREIGNTNLSYGVSVWQSSHLYLERAFGAVVGAEVRRIGHSFHVLLPTCRITFYANNLGRPEDFRLGESSGVKKSILDNNQMTLFNYTMDSSAQPVTVPELVVIHEGNPEEHLLTVHIGAPISADRKEDGWLWLQLLYKKGDSDGPGLPVDISTSPVPPGTPTFRDLPAPTIIIEEIEEKPAERQRLRQR